MKSKISPVVRLRQRLTWGGVPDGDRTEVFILAAALIVVLLCYVWLTSYIADGAFMPAYSDEYGYYLRTMSFVENNSLHSSVLLEDAVSRVGNQGSHSFAYTLFHGLIAKVFGFRPLTMVITNMVLLSLALGLIAVQRLPAVQRLFLIVTTLLHFMLPICLFSYMQETIHLFFAVVIGLLLLLVYRNPEPARRRLGIALYVAAVVIASVFRVSWAFCFFALIPLAKNRRQALLYTLASLAVVGAAFAVTDLYTAPYPYGYLVWMRTALREGDILRFAKLVICNLGNNLHRFFAQLAPFYHVPGAHHATAAATRIGISYFLSKYLLVFLVALCLWLGFRKKDRLAIGVGVVAVVNILALFLLYDALDWREHRSLASLFFLVTLVAVPFQRVRSVVTALLFVLFAQPLSYTRTAVISSHRAMAAKFNASQEAVAAIRSIRDMVHEHRLTTILVSRFFARMTDVHILSLPVKSRTGYPIRYTFNFGHENDFAVATRTPGFIDYVLVPERTTGPDGMTHVTVKLVRPSELSQ